MRMACPLFVERADVAVLRRWVDSTDPDSALCLRARIVLLCGEGWGPSAVARELACSKQTVITWRERYRVSGIAGLAGGLRSGRPPKVDPAVVIGRTLESPGVGARWSTRSLGAELGLSNVAVANVWRRWGVKPLTGGRVLLMTDPVLDTPVTALLGLHVDPPLHVLAVMTDASSGGRCSRPRTPDLTCWSPDSAEKVDRSGRPDPARAADFGRRIGRARRSGAPARMRLVVTGDAAAVTNAVPGGAPAVHVVGDVASWRRIAWVCCLMVGSDASTAASVVATRSDQACTLTWGDRST